MPKTNKSTAALPYLFIFNPKEAWSRMSDFEADLAAFLKFNGMEAEIIRNVAGDGFFRMVYIKPRGDAMSGHDEPNKPKKLRYSKTDAPKSQMKRMGRK